MIIHKDYNLNYLFVNNNVDKIKKSCMDFIEMKEINKTSFIFTLNLYHPFSFVTGHISFLNLRFAYKFGK